MCLSRVEEQGIVVERRFEGHHQGVVKCIRWRCEGGGGGRGVGVHAEAHHREIVSRGGKEDDAWIDVDDGREAAAAAPGVFASCGGAILCRGTLQANSQRGVT